MYNRYTLRKMFLCLRNKNIFKDLILINKKVIFFKISCRFYFSNQIYTFLNQFLEKKINN